MSKTTKKPPQPEESSQQPADKRPFSPTPHTSLETLQNSVGNQAITQLVQASQGQKPLLSQSNSPLEQSADQIAQNALNTPTHTPPATTNQTAPSGHPLPPTTRQQFENRFNQDLSHIRIHHNDQIATTAEALNARAYTIGDDIVFNKNEYQPHTPQGQQLLAHEIAHTTQNQSAAPAIQRTPQDKEDPTRFTTIHDSLMVQRPGGTSLTWHNAGSANPTADLLKQEVQNALKALAQQNSMAFLGSIPANTSEADAETDAKQADQNIHARYPFIPTTLTNAQIEAAVSMLTAAKTSGQNYLEQWLTNKLISWTDIEQYNIQMTDARVIQLINDLLSDTTTIALGKTTEDLLKILAGRQSAFIETSGNTREIFLNKGISATRRGGTLTHELIHFYAHPDYNRWVNQTTSKQFYNEGFTEYLARPLMTPAQLAKRGKGYDERWQAIKDDVAKYASDDDIARAFFLGEVWRLESTSAVSQELFKKHIHLDSSGTRQQEIDNSRTGPGINQEVAAGSHYRFLNLGVNHTTPKPEHIAYFKELYQEHINGKAVTIRFVGHASATGQADHNSELSAKRATAFYKMARAAGVPENQLKDIEIADTQKPAHHGQSKPTASNDDVHGRSFNRRVELIIEQK